MGCTPLHEAATYNNYEVAKLLLRKGAEVKVEDEAGCTALHLAAVEGTPHVLQLIIKHVLLQEGHIMLSSVSIQQVLLVSLCFMYIVRHRILYNYILLNYVSIYSCI